ncbi:ethanolamine utilization protein EutJ [Brevibacillus daliensis]|uniref:ethanolamine utilization protein EutJ n=1 Tax=Brevibacillus daliensis TaxID=2892995 RepID=UPI001E33CF0B|nr:ethanolamine utilization protein EutJ [Brevibacillus daliensis]
MELLTSANKQLEQLQAIMNTDTVMNLSKDTSLKVGVDLGTSSIVLVVLDQNDRPVFGAFEYANAVRDGLVVNYRESVDVVKRLKERAENCLGRTLVKAAGAVPPGTIGNNKRVVENVIESAEMESGAIIDEPTAAASLIGLQEGAVVDVGGGTTGISVFKKGEVIYTADEPTGGTHMTLVLAGYYGISVADAEKQKRLQVDASSNFLIMRPVVEKMAEITRRHLVECPSTPIYIVGGATAYTQFLETFRSYLKADVFQPVFPQYVTPMGIAMNG